MDRQKKGVTAARMMSRGSGFDRKTEIRKF
jgi:hypothetical protein